jgi:hypothetical protein
MPPFVSQSYLLGKMRGLMKGLPDLERGLARIHYLKSSPQELVRILSAFQRIADEFPKLPEDLKASSIGFKTDLVNGIFNTLPKIQPVVKVFVEQINLTRAREGSKADFWKNEYEPEEVTDCKDLLEAVEAEVCRPCGSSAPLANSAYLTVCRALEGMSKTSKETGSRVHHCRPGGVSSGGRKHARTVVLLSKADRHRATAHLRIKDCARELGQNKWNQSRLSLPVASHAELARAAGPGQ